MVTQGAFERGCTQGGRRDKATTTDARCGSVVQVVIHYPDPRKVGLVVEGMEVAGRQVADGSRLRNAAERMWSNHGSNDRPRCAVWGLFARRKECDPRPGCAEDEENSAGRQLWCGMLASAALPSLHAVGSIGWRWFTSCTQRPAEWAHCEKSPYQRAPLHAGPL